jgi:hypothetical protein
MRNRVRQDLHDTDPLAYRWSDTALDRHIAHAVEELSAVWPRVTSATIAVGTGGRTYDVGGIPDLAQSPQAILAVEWPYDPAAPIYPPPLVPFRLDGTTLTLLTPEAPLAGQAIRVWYGAPHILSEDETTLGIEDEPVVSLGAAAYATLERASLAIEQVSVSGYVPSQYLAWGERALARFQGILAERRRQFALLTDSRVMVRAALLGLMV